MDTRNLVVGSRIEHGQEGAGTVTYVGADFIGIAFDKSGEALIRRDVLEKEQPAEAAAVETPREDLPWPESTFVAESVDARHYLGSHWEPFAEDSTGIMKGLPDILGSALPQTGYGEMRKPSRTVPDAWPGGFQLVWPLRTQGLAMVVRMEKEANTIVSLFPFFATGSQHTLTLREVSVWDGGMEAQITASWSEGSVTFFDTQYVINRAWYETGRDYDFILSGVAYNAAPARKMEWKIKQHPDQVAWMNQRLQAGEEPHGAECMVTLDGAAMFLPIGEWDADDYRFHAPVKSVREFKDWLGQDGWKLRATVLRFGDEDVDLDILISRRAWSGDAPPEAGQDIEGRLWLQGYLWQPR